MIRKAISTLVLAYLCLSIFMVTALCMLGAPQDTIVPWLIMSVTALVSGVILSVLGILDLN